MTFENLKFDSSGLIPAVVQDALTKEVLTLAYMNKESLQKSLETNETWFYSRSRQELWHKGETSGNTQVIQSIAYDCDQDSLVVLVKPNGPACHTGTTSCFTEVLYEASQSVSNDKEDIQFLYQLEELIAQRERERPEGSYTTYLFEKGIDKILKKLERKQRRLLLRLKIEIMMN